MSDYLELAESLKDRPTEQQVSHPQRYEIGKAVKVGGNLVVRCNGCGLYNEYVSHDESATSAANWAIAQHKAEVLRNTGAGSIQEGQGNETTI